ncbi:MAG: SDR family NAD(P)-dependent oxidoreductase, partial [Acidobacteria bacterium]|nr:SDR family NAD(P)-dependent oxidoreductase [Acidobacteriota bacterium]
LNLRGPSLAIDTACSSSLVALAQACDNLVAGHSDMALAGGVYLTAGPEMHIRSSQAGMLSPNGRCFTFDQRADGLVMGEGVGVVLLKRLADAERDGDIIHAVLEGWGVNQDGKTNGITAPNAESQASLEQSVYDKYRIDPANIQLIEAHGTGTKLGDPIEIEGLKTAFKKYTRKSDYCALGSVKSNIGHCAQAAGIAGVLKLVLAVKNRQLPPTIHFERLNEHIELAGSPFYVNTRLQEWQSDVRRAAISSFGFSGTNAHMVIGEYVPCVTARRVTANRDAIIPLSARTPEQLRAKAADLLAFLRADASVDLHSVAYTLQTGRAAMDERLGFVVRSVVELIDALGAWLAGERPSCEMRQGRAKRGKVDATPQLLASWVEGGTIDWERLYVDGKPQRIALPLYPFARERYWIETQQPHTWTLTGDEFFLAEHLVRIDGKAQKVLPGVACLELVRSAVAKAFPSRAIELRDTVWLQPIVVVAPLQIRVVLSSLDEDQVAYEIRGKDVLHCQGRALLSDAAAQDQIDLETIRRRTAQTQLQPADVYAAFVRMGIQHGPSFQAIAAIQHGQGESMTRLRLPDSVAHTANDYALHPSLMDAALQGYMVLIDGWLDATQPRLPFALESLRILAPCSRDLVVWVRPAAGSDRMLKLDFDLCDERGNVCVQMRGFSPRLVGKEAKAGMLLAAPVWQPAIAAAPTAMERHIVLCGLPNVSAEQIESLVPRSFCTSTPANASYSDVAVACFERIQNILRGKPEHTVGMQLVIADPLFAGVSGMLKTAALENPLFAGQVLLVPPSTTSEELAMHLRAETPNSDALVRYERGVRHVQRWSEIAEGSAPLAFKDDGVYLITGGRGGVGSLFTREILAKTRNARVILTSRTGAEENGRVSCRQADLETLRDVEQLIAAIVEEHGRLDGILHCAGMIADDFLVKKSSEDFRRVLAPKVTGSLHLDLATRHLDLDFFALFSSIASAFGNIGQADYAAANGFLDRFAALRNQQQRGRTCSIHWPFWEEGGMRTDAESQERMQQLTGLQPMSTETAMQAFARSLTLAHDELLVMTGDLAQIRRSLFAAPIESPATIDADTLAEKTQDYLRRELAGTFKIAAEKLDPHEPLETYGVDSILAMRLTTRLEQTFGALSKTLFFEYQTIAELTKYFLRAHAARVTALFAPANAKPQPQTAAAVVQAAPPPAIVAPQGKASHDEPIAIIGLSGRYPGALDVEAYWNNLRDGKDCITDIPKERWDWQQYFSEVRGENGRQYGKWGGFIEGVDEFDALFFNISPKEARATDPQERLFLQHAWAAIEDAGYTRAGLHAPHEGDLPGQVGVYAGVWCSEYQLLGAQASEHGEGQGVAVSVGSIANRVSYALDLHGPSITLDTMCSSSLTAIHLACQDLRLGRTRMAIAGGVNVSIHPNKYLMLSAAQALASDGRCRSFGEGGDGYVPAEGVGVIVLKRLSDAERDGDPIYGTIRASALNHGGKTNGYTVPSPQAQASAIGRALRESGIDARHISYVESHGTGTKLGDPIEIAALDKAFRQSTTDTQFCAIGSVKSNIGHCESAAGIAGLTKILLQMQHGQLVPSLHTAELNAHVDFDRTPFVVNRALRPWERPTIAGREMPRIAGISSFGAGGANAHLIIEEYQAPARQVVVIDNAAIVLSARTTEQLQQRAADLLRFVRARRNELDLASLAYTLQTGREAMDVRFGFVANSLEQTIAKLEAFVAGDLAMEDAWQGDVKRNKEALAVFGADADLQQTVEKWIASRKLPRLLDLWVKGLDVEWTKLYDAMPQRISLPAYPFAKDRHWIDVVKPAAAPAKPVAEMLHPLLHSNVSTLQEQRYRTVLTGDEPFVPACLEMARAAMEHASPSTDASSVLELRDVAWSLPLVAGRKEVSIVLTPGAGNEIEFEIFSEVDGQETVHCQGRAMRSAASAPARVELAQLRALPTTMSDVDALHAALLACNEAAPASLESLRVFSSCTREMFVSTRGQDIDLCDARGNVCVQMRGISWPQPQPAVEVAAPARREITLSEIVPISIGPRKPAAIALAAPSVPLLQKSAASARISLKDTSRPATPSVKLHDDGNGTFTLDIAPRSDDASVQAALERAQQEPGLKALLVRGLEPVSDALLQAIAAFPLPTIAMLQNDTVGTAFVAAALCDFLVCNEDASYRCFDPSIANRFGELRAQDLLLGAMTGRQLRERGWTCPIVPAAEVESHARTLAASFAQKSNESLRLLKRHLATSGVTMQRQDGANRVLSIAFGDLRALANIEDHQAIVLTNLPEAMSDEDVASFHRTLSGVTIPVIAALEGDARGNAWLAAQLCDACVYASDGIYSAKDIAPMAAAIFTQKLGKAAGAEIVLTAADFSGADLQRRAGAQVADRDEVQSTAMRLAESWSTKPTRIPMTESVANVQDDEPLAIDTPTVVFRSPVVTATAHPDGVVVIAMEDRDAKNMFSDAFLAGVQQAFAHIAETPAYKVVVLTGYDRYFVSGGTKEGLLAIQQGKTKFTDSDIYHVALSCKLPVIAAMQGHAIGAGLAMGMFADVVLLGEESRYVSPYMGYGFTPGAGATYILPEVIGKDLAREGLLTAQHATGAEWRARGLRLNILPRADVLDTAMAMARQMARASRRRLLALKQALTAHIHDALAATYQRELAMHEQTFVGRSDTLALIEDTFHEQVEVVAAPAPVVAAATEAFDNDALPSVAATLRSLLANELLLRDSDIDDQTQFVDLGLESISAVTWLKKINEKYQTAIDATKIYSHPTLAQLAPFVMTEARKSGALTTVAAPAPRPLATPVRVMAPQKTQTLVSRRKRGASRFVAAPAQAQAAAPARQAIAIVGMAGQFPQARNLDEFWQNLAEGKNCISEIPADRWALQTYFQKGGAAPGKTNCPYVGALPDHDRFDPLFFNISPTEAENMDPQQRLFLQSCWHAIEHAGYDARALSGTRAGVFAGCGTSDYHDYFRTQQLSAHAFTGGATSILAARISYFLNLQGPCVAIDTACSSSLVAIAQACDSLNAGGSDVALAGGVYVMSGPSMHVMTAQAGMLSPEGKCFTFDQRADGFVPGEGVGVVMLKRLADAQRDGDVIHGVIEGWGINQDGKTNGITAPNPESQTRLEQEVYDRHGIDPAHIQLVEAHGTGTKLGDPIEVEGLKQAFKKYTQKTEYCAIGSVKSNIGHTLMAAGVAGVLKIILALQHKKLPPTINFERLNEHIDL